MNIYRINEHVYRRTKEYAHAQGKTVSQFVEAALKQLLGMEGLPLDDEAVYGEDTNEIPSISP